MTGTAEQIAIAEEAAVLKQLAAHHGGGVEGIEGAFRQRVRLFHPDAGYGGEPGKFHALVAARDQLLAQAAAVEAALPWEPKSQRRGTS